MGVADFPPTRSIRGQEEEPPEVETFRRAMNQCATGDPHVNKKKAPPVSEGRSFVALVVWVAQASSIIDWAKGRIRAIMSSVLFHSSTTAVSIFSR